MLTFKGKKDKKYPNRFRTDDGYILSFDKELPLFDDIEYFIVCSKDEQTKLYKILQRKEVTTTE